MILPKPLQCVEVCNFSDIPHFHRAEWPPFYISLQHNRMDINRNGQ